MGKASNTPPVKGGFYLIVDSRKYGPFLEAARSQYSDLEHRKGVQFKEVRLRGGWVEPVKPPPRIKPDKTTPLLEGIGFTPTFRR